MLTTSSIWIVVNSLFCVFIRIPSYGNFPTTHTLYLHKNMAIICAELNVNSKLSMSNFYNLSQILMFFKKSYVWPNELRIFSPEFFFKLTQAHQNIPNLFNRNANTSRLLQLLKTGLRVFTQWYYFRDPPLTTLGSI